jgi:predicted RNase H-like nuclease (RuvC/YqgF family)
LINKDVSDSNFVSKNETIYQNKNKDREIELLYKSCQLKDKEIELLKKENDLLSRISNEYKQQMDAYMKRISELEKNASGLFEGNKQTK